MIPQPCHKKWNELTGEGRERFCAECQSSVYAKALYSDDEWERVRAERGGNLCALLTIESAPTPRSRRAILAGALLTVVSPLMAQDGRIRVRLIDPIGIPVSNGDVLVSGNDSKGAKTLKTDKAGEALFSGLAVGSYTIRAKVAGFNTVVLHVNVSNSKEVLVTPRLELGTVGTTVDVPEPAPGFDTPLPVRKRPTAR